MSFTHSEVIVRRLAELGRTLSNGEILQLTNIQSQEISEEVYFRVIEQKTAALFEACAAVGALSVGASEKNVAAAEKFGSDIGIIFQIRDDIFDYYDSTAIGKPTGNDMAEGKLTLPVIYALRSAGDETMMSLARKVKTREINTDEIARLVAFTKTNGGIEYAEQRMNEYRKSAMAFIDTYVSDPGIKSALTAYVDFIIDRNV